MSWQLAIYIKLGINKQSHLIVTDETALLSDTTFIEFLEDRLISVQSAPTLQGFFKLRQTTPTIVLTELTDIPTFIANKYDYKTFSYKDLPLNGDLSILRGLAKNELAAVLDYIFSHDRHIVINAHNIERLKAESLKYQRQSTLKKQERHIKLFLSETIPTAESVLTLGQLWGAYIYESTELGEKDYLALIERVDNFSETFFLNNGMEEAILGSTDRKPKTVNRILGHIKREKADKIALICFDCMGIAEWTLLKTYLSDLNWRYEENAIFSLLPSITAIARSAIFHGNYDVYGLKYPGRSDESTAFGNYFSEQETKYFTDADVIDENSLLGYNYVSVLFPFFDDLCHASIFPPLYDTKNLYFQAVKQYIAQSKVKNTLKILSENGYKLYFCSDHGSVVATGNGKKVEKYIQDKFAKRACMIPKDSSDLTNHKKLTIPYIEDKVLALPERRTMFTNKGKVEINHGGITVEEMVVPFIKVI